MFVCLFFLIRHGVLIRDNIQLLYFFLKCSLRLKITFLFKAVFLFNIKEKESLKYHIFSIYFVCSFPFAVNSLSERKHIVYQG